MLSGTADDITVAHGRPIKGNKDGCNAAVIAIATRGKLLFFQPFKGQRTYYDHLCDGIPKGQRTSYRSITTILIPSIPLSDKRLSDILFDGIVGARGRLSGILFL